MIEKIIYLRIPYHTIATGSLLDGDTEVFLIEK
jgi:hypothetical protein